MPTPPREGESKEEFLARCAKYMHENHPGKDEDQQLAICHAMWEDKYRKTMREKTK